MAMIPNPDNGYVPKVGEKVKVVGGCHPRMLGRVVEVTAVNRAIWWAEIKYTDDQGEEFYTGGLLGGLEPIVGGK
jgi:hypothetical protein